LYVVHVGSDPFGAPVLQAVSAELQFAPRIDWLFVGWIEAAAIDDPASWTTFAGVNAAIVGTGADNTYLRAGVDGVPQHVSDVEGGVVLWSEYGASSFNVWGAALGGTPAIITFGPGHEVTADMHGARIVYSANLYDFYHVEELVLPAFLDAEVGMAHVNEIYASVAGSDDANGDGTSDLNDDEFVEIVSDHDWARSLGGYELIVDGTVRHIFAPDTVLPARGSIVVFGDGTPTGTFGASEVVTASTGGLVLGDGSGSVTLRTGDGTMTVIDELTYAGAPAGESLVSASEPDPDVAFVAHTAMPEAAGRRYSPGTLADRYGF
jgi:hypothetical protein